MSSSKAEKIAEHRYSCYSLDTGKEKLTCPSYSVELNLSAPDLTKSPKVSSTLDGCSELPLLDVTDSDYPSSDAPYGNLLSRLQSSVRREEAMLRTISQSTILEPALAEELVQELSQQLEQSERESRSARENLEETKRFYSSQIQMYEKQIADIHKGAGKDLNDRILNLERENTMLRSQMEARENLHFQVIGGLKTGLEKEVEESKAITTHYRKKQNETNQQFNNLREQITYLGQMKDTLELKVQTQQDRIDKLQFEASRNEKVTRELQSELSQRRNEYLKVQEIANEKYTKLSDWQSKQFEKMKSERVELMKTLEKERLKNADLEAKILSLGQSIEGEVKLKEAERKNVLSLQTKIQDLERIQIKLEKRMVDSDLQHQMYSKQMKHKSKILERRMNDLTEANQKLQLENHELGSKLNSVRGTKARLISELDRTRAVSVAEVKRLETCVPNLLNKIKQENAALGKRINEQIATLRSEKEDLQEQVREGEKALKEAEAQFEKMKTLTESSEVKVGKLEHRLAVSKTGLLYIRTQTLPYKIEF